MCKHLHLTVTAAEVKAAHVSLENIVKDRVRWYDVLHYNRRGRRTVFAGHVDTIAHLRKSPTDRILSNLQEAIVDSVEVKRDQTP